MGIARNYVYNIMLTITNLLVPFITTPYISRVLDPEGIGAVAFTGSIVQYFVLLAMLGTGLYGAREVASLRDDPKKLKIVFWNIQYTKILTTVFSYVSFLFFVVFSDSKYQPLYLIQSFLILNSVLDITFLFTGLEEFTKITTRGLLVKLTGTGLIFLIIREPSDYYLYALINVVTALLGSMIMWLYLPKYVSVTKPSFQQIKYHLLGSLKLFVPIAATEVYTVLDKTMVGLLTAESEVGYYTMSQKLVKMVLGLVTSIGVVMMPRISNLVANQDKKQIQKYSQMIFDFVTYASIIVMILIAVTMKDFVPLFFGSKFLKVKDLTVYIAPIILFISWSNLFGVQIMIPMKKENYLTISVTLGATINFILNLTLIPKYQALGAVIGTVVAEFTVTIVQIILVRKLISLKPLFSEIWKHISAGIAVILILLPFIQIDIKPIIKIILECLFGLLTYILIEAVLKSNTNKMIIHKFFAFVKR